MLEHFSDHKLHFSVEQRKFSGAIFQLAPKSIVHELRFFQFRLPLSAPIVLSEGLYYRLSSAHLRCTDRDRLRGMGKYAPAIAEGNMENLHFIRTPCALT